MARSKVKGGSRTKSTRTVTLQVLRHAPTAEPVAADKAAKRERRGDIVDVVLTPPNADRVDNDWFWRGGVHSRVLGFVHMRDVPEERWQHMRKRFSEGLTVTNKGEADNLDEEPEDLARRRRWRFQISQIAAQKRAELVNDGETTFAWDAARAFIVKKAWTDPLDPTKDTITPVSDEDLPP